MPCDPLTIGHAERQLLTGCKEGAINVSIAVQIERQSYAMRGISPSMKGEPSSWGSITAGTYLEAVPGTKRSMLVGLLRLPSAAIRLLNLEQWLRGFGRSRKIWGSFLAYMENFRDVFRRRLQSLFDVLYRRRKQVSNFVVSEI